MGSLFISQYRGRGIGAHTLRRLILTTAESNTNILLLSSLSPYSSGEHGAFKILMMEGDALELENGADVLMSSERLSNDSPVMWPDQQHFFGDFNPLHLSPAPPEWLLDVTKDDMASINELASLTPAQLMDKIRVLQNMAYQLGVEEARQMSRGRHLNVFRPRLLASHRPQQ